MMRSGPKTGMLAGIFRPGTTKQWAHTEYETH